MGTEMMRSEQRSQRLKLQQLRVFLAVGRTSSMAKAAKHLTTSQSVVSKTVAELENALGVRLVDRTPHGVELTLYGRTLLKRSVEILDDLRESVSEIDVLAEPGVGELRIGTTEPQAGIVVRTIERLSRQYPRLDLKVVVAPGATLIDRELRGRQIDLVVGVLPKPEEEDLDATFLYHNRIRVVVGTKSRWARRRNVKLSDLINEPWCGPTPDIAGGASFVEGFKASGLPLPRLVVSCAANHLCHGLLADGRFVSISSDGPLHFSRHGPPLKVLAVDFPAPPFEISIIRLKDRTITPMAELFSECARELTKPLARNRPT
jgi:DNA-binding transcriptional LysR family regulator